MSKDKTNFVSEFKMQGIVCLFQKDDRRGDQLFGITRTKGSDILRTNILVKKFPRSKTSESGYDVKNQYFKIVFFGRLGERYQEEVKRGAEVWITGNVGTYTSENREGVKYTSYQFVANDFEVVREPEYRDRRDGDRNYDCDRDRGYDRDSGRKSEGRRGDYSRDNNRDDHRDSDRSENVDKRDNRDDYRRDSRDDRRGNNRYDDKRDGSRGNDYDDYRKTNPRDPQSYDDNPPNLGDGNEFVDQAEDDIPF